MACIPIQGGVICVPAGTYFGQVRDGGCRRWRTVTRACRTPEAALILAIRRMGDAPKARALWVDAGGGWYEPYVAMEAST